MKKNNNFFKKNKLYLIIGVLAVIWVCFIFFVILPSLNSLRSDYDSVQMKLLEIQNSENKLSKLNILKSNFEEVDSKKENLGTVFHKDNIVFLVKELELIAQKTGNRIKISVDEENKKILEVKKDKANKEENELLKSLPSENFFSIKINLIGDYNGLIKFVDKLNNIKYYNSVTSFKILSKEIVLEDESGVESNNSTEGINALNSSNESLSSEDGNKIKEKLLLNSDLDVIFYSLEKNDGAK
ncbi:MAG: hypothetical protein UR60_C0016G0007 [Candidatus Moranbacteria bacterium GW2011_GWF2_34_56]|nr:MAG: hypothetical protein UR51_C0009G0083 [Candidatus Moranbacteria bacterium GW2011_GWF1_34_10]KKP64733.1 MAG: hypothetical protein UR60_C0016G0007 [Candidatus Moranbacteria bacterium GW2011_GWF2_34_56]HBI17427.1 hypothetical protein [Candidatus Moranbacteria bacterium]